MVSVQLTYPRSVSVPEILVRTLAGGNHFPRAAPSPNRKVPCMSSEKITRRDESEAPRAKDAGRSPKLQVGTISNLPARIGSQLGVDFTESDRLYLFLSFMSFIENPPSASERIRSFPAFLDKVVPDTEGTRHATARLLSGFQVVAGALATILDNENIDVLRELKDAIRESVDTLPAQGELNGAELNRLATDLGVRLRTVLENLGSNADSRMRAAIRTLGQLDQLLDVKQPLPIQYIDSPLDLALVAGPMKRRTASRGGRKGRRKRSDRTGQVLP
jgi:hypothetical protein